MAKEYNVVVTKENVSKFLDGVLDFVYANRPQEYSIEIQASINELPRYEIHVERIPTLIVEPKEVTDGNYCSYCGARMNEVSDEINN